MEWRALKSFILKFSLTVFISILFAFAIFHFNQDDRWLGVSKKSSAITANVIFPHFEAGPGLPHYLEHLTWLNAIDTKSNLSRQSNAWASNYTVGYWLSGAPSDLLGLLAELKGVFEPLSLSDSFALEERNVVLREYEFRIVGNPKAQVREAMNTFLYAENLLASSVMGTREDIMGLTYEQAQLLHAKTHRPDNAVLVVTGNFTQRELTRAIAQAAWPQSVPVADVLVPPAFDLATPAAERFEIVDSESAPRLIWRKVVTLPDRVQFDLLEAQTGLLTAMLDTNLPGGIAGPLRFNASIARSFDIRIWPIDEDNIEVKFVAVPDSGVTLLELEKAFDTIFERIVASGIPQDTYARVLTRFDSFWPDWNDDEETAKWMAEYVLDRVAVLRTPLSERELKRLSDELSLPTTNSLLEQLSGEGRTAIAYIGPEENFR